MKKISLILVFLMLLVFGCGFSAPFNVSAYEDVVLKELQSSVIEGKAFNIDDYKKDAKGTPDFIVFAERNFYRFDNSKYALEVYVFNPTGIAFGESSNTLQMSINGSYRKYELAVVNTSKGEYANIFYKFQVVNPVFVPDPNGSFDRVYKVSGIELNCNGSIIEYPIERTYTYSGEGSTLQSAVDFLDTISLDVKNFTYRYLNGINTQSVLHTACFGVDQEYFDKYDFLSKIHAQWIKAHTSPIIIVNDEDIYDELYSFVGIDISQLDEADHPSYCLYQQVMDGSSKMNWAYNLDPKYTIYEKTDKLTSVFFTEETDYFFASEELIEYFAWYTSRFGSADVAGKYSSDLFNKVDPLTDVVISSDDKFSIDGFDTGSGFSNWWSHLVYPDLQGSSIENIDPIYCVQDSDLIGSDETVAERLLLGIEEVPEFRSLYSANKLAGKRTYLFRFAVGNYTANDVMAHNGKLFGGDARAVDKVDMDVYLNFDIIDLTFNADNVDYVVPAVSSPVDSFPDVEPPVDDVLDKLILSVSSFWDKFKRIALIVVGIIAAIIVFKLVRGVIRFIRGK